MPSNLVYSTVVFLHVLAAIVLIGSSLSFAVTRRFIRSAGTVQELLGWLAFARSGSAANPVAALGLLATGVYLGSQGWWTQPWFHVALAVYFFDALYAVRRMHAAAAELGEAAAAAAPGPVPRHVDELRWAARLDLPADLLLAGDLGILFVMLVKPGLALSCGALALATAVLAVVRRRRRAARPSAAADHGARAEGALAG